MHMDDMRVFHRSGLLPIRLNDPDSYGLDMLVRLVTAPKEVIGYTPPDDIKRIIESSGVKFTFKTLLVKRSGIRGTFVVGGSVDSETAILKVSRNDQE